MVWKREDPQGNEAAKVKWELVPYTRGRVLDIGAGAFKAFPHFIGVDNYADTRIFGHQFRTDLYVDDARELKILASGQFDAVFSSHLLEHIEQKHVVATLKEWWRVVKPGGYLILYLPDETLYPKVGEPGANPDHKWNVSYTRLIEMMQRTEVDWNLEKWERRDQGQEYSLLTVFRKLDPAARGVFKKSKPTQSFSKDQVKPEKSAGVVRYGAYGDLLQASSVLAALKAEGYHITFYTAPPGDDVMRHDPNIDRFYLQDKDQVPNNELGAFWTWEAQKYDKWVNLSESVERTFLALPQTTPYLAPPAARHWLLDRNYIEFQHQLAGVAHVPAKVTFYPTQEERTWARTERRAIGGDFCMVYALNGSSVHKRWPWMDQLIAALLLDFPGLEIVLVGGPDGQILEQGWFGWDKDPKKHDDAKKVQTEPRVHCRSGRWDIRQTLSFLAQADMVFGPETGVLNAAANLPIPKVVLLSHSTPENLCRDWVNVHALQSQGTECPGRGKNEAPACHRMHYDWSGCKQVMFGDDAPDKTLVGQGMGVAQCAYDLSFEEVYRVVWHVVTWEKERRAKPLIAAVGK
jgi:ADP-heptose:LPS heptosyltransferase/predicted SAM-dependent methyltransferase